MTYEKCPNCNRSLKGFLSASLVTQSKTNFINNQTGKNAEAYCSTCSTLLLNDLGKKLKSEKDEIEKRLKQIVGNIPVLTCPAPVNCSYDVIDMITAQTTSGTGFATELSRSFNDFFGTTSNASNQKILKATEICKADLRIQCIKKGGNAIISTDIDYSEIGSGSSNMLMVCISGTAIKVNNLDFFNENKREYVQEAIDLTEKLLAIDSLTSNNNF